MMNASPQPDVPILVETPARRYFPMVRCHYLSSEYDTPIDRVLSTSNISRGLHASWDSCEERAAAGQDYWELDWRPQ